MASSKGAFPKHFATPKKQEKKEEVVRALTQLYGHSLDAEIINSVAFNARYDLHNSSRLLQEMTNNVGFQSVTGRKRKPKQHDRPKVCFGNSSAQNLNDADVIIEGEFDLNHAKKFTSPERIPKNSLCVHLDKIIGQIIEGHRVLIIMRGIPGSGKSYLARELVKKSVNMDNRLFVFSTDDYFQRGGRYMYNPSHIQVAHEWNMKRVNDHMLRGVSPVIVDNTNTQEWEMLPYVRMALLHGYFVNTVEPKTSWVFNDRECARKNLHNVPRDKIKDMLDRYERNITGDSLIERLRGKYTRKPPIPRNYPPINPRQNFSSLKNGGTSIGAGESDFSAKGGVRDLLSFEDNEERFNKVPPSFSIDDILKCDETVNSEVMQAVLNPVKMESVPNVSTAATTSTGIYPKLDLESWGVKEEEISAWDVVKPTDKPIMKNPFEPLPQRENERPFEIKTQTSETGTITNCSGIESDPDVKILVARSRSISAGAGGRPTRTGIPLKVSTLDKSTMIDDDVISVTRETEATDVDIDIERDVSELLLLFPDVSKENLADLYRRCEGDVNWMVDLLLDHPKGNLPKPPSPPPQAETPLVQIAVPVATKPEVPELSTSSLVKGSKELIQKYESFTLESLQIKKQLEECIDINPEYYSPHVQQIKNFKHGKVTASTDVTKPIEIPSKSVSTQLNSSSAIISPKSSDETSSESCRGHCSDDTDTTDLDESELDFLNEYNQDTMELHLGDSFVDQLESKFGDPNLTYPKGFQPVVQVPVSLARQLHAFYLESIFQQMETQNQVLESMMMEDLVFAKKLQEKENELASSGASAFHVPPSNVDMKALIDQEMANKLYQQQMDEWKNELPDNIAYKLSKGKLVGKFPSVDENTLVEILHAHGNCFDKTVEALKATGIEEKEAEDEFVENGRKVKESAMDSLEIEVKSTMVKSAEDENDAADALSAQDYRQIAQMHIRKRQEMYEKAQNALKAGLTPAAQYYLEQAKHQTSQYELANHRAASAFLQQHSDRLNHASDTLDLHYLFVEEALSALDIFLDEQISNLETSKRTGAQVMIITGRGKHSGDGRSRIKPAVIKRLKRRSLRYAEMNPGLLKVHIKKHSPLTNNL